MITSFPEFAKLPEGTLFAFDHEPNSLYYIEESKRGMVSAVVYVREFTGYLPKKAMTQAMWTQNKVRIGKVFTIEEMNGLEATLLTLTGLLLQ